MNQYPKFKICASPSDPELFGVLIKLTEQTPWTWDGEDSYPIPILRLSPKENVESRLNFLTNLLT
jgi:hypothetical protein